MTRARLRRPGLLLFAVLALAHFLWLARQLVYPDLIAAYPFMGGDSHDWIANGLFFAGHDVRFSARPPLVPLVLAALYGLGALSLFPVLLQMVVHLTALGLYHLLRRDHPRLLAFPIAAAWLANGTWLRLSFEVMADVPAACLLAWSVFAWRRDGPRPGYVLAGLFGGLSAVTQQLALLLPAAVLPVVLRFRRRDLASRPFLVGAALFLAPTCGWLLFKKLALGTTGDVLNRNWSLLAFHTDSLGHYLYASLAFVGLPATAGILAGAVSFTRRAPQEAWCAFVLGLQAVILVFFVLLYDFDSLRFLAYVFPLAAVLLAEGLARLPPVPRTGAALLVLAWALLPSPGTRPDPTRIVLWPLPLVHAKAAITPAGAGSSRVDPTAVELEVRPGTALLESSLHRRLAQRRRQPSPTRGLDPDDVREDRWALSFYEDPAQAGMYFGVVTKLGNLLLKRVHHLPFSAFEAAWPRLRLDRLGVVDTNAVYRARIPGRDGSWLVAVPAAGRADRSLRAPLRKAREAADEIARAQEIAALLGRNPTVIFATEEGLEPWQTYLPFLLDTPRFFVIEPARAPGTRRMLGVGRELERRGDVILFEHRLFGWPWIVVETTAGSP